MTNYAVLQYSNSPHVLNNTQ